MNTNAFQQVMTFIALATQAAHAKADGNCTTNHRKVEKAVTCIRPEHTTLATKGIAHLFPAPAIQAPTVTTPATPATTTATKEATTMQSIHLFPVINIEGKTITAYAEPADVEYSTLDDLKVSARILIAGAKDPIFGMTGVYGNSLVVILADAAWLIKANGKLVKVHAPQPQAQRPVVNEPSFVIVEPEDQEPTFDDEPPVEDHSDEPFTTAHEEQAKAKKGKGKKAKKADMVFDIAYIYGRKGHTLTHGTVWNDPYTSQERAISHAKGRLSSKGTDHKAVLLWDRKNECWIYVTRTQVLWPENNLTLVKGQRPANKASKKGKKATRRDPFAASA